MALNWSNVVSLVFYSQTEGPKTSEDRRTYHVPIHALHPQQLRVAAALHHLALAEDVDDVGLLDRREPVRDRDSCPALGHALKGGLDELLALCGARRVRTGKRGFNIGKKKRGGGGGGGAENPTRRAPAGGPRPPPKKSLPESSELVASSSSKTRGLRIRARAMETRCFWPPLRLTPRLPMRVS